MLLRVVEGNLGPTLIRDIRVSAAESAANEAARSLAAEALAWADKVARGKKSG
jgi:hypothetical protein